MEQPFEICLLGPIEIRRPSGSTPISGVRLQSLVAMLALGVPHPVSDDRLVEGLWGEDQPANPANALQALVSQLRRLIGRTAVERRGGAYLLALSPDAVDAKELERMVQEGRDAANDGDHRRAEQNFGAAVALDRGPPLGPLADAWFAREAAATLGELVLAAHEGWAASALALGRHDDVVVPLTELVAAHPARERLRALLMLALYRSGRQRDALQVARDARAYLLDELGLDPGPELQELERSVLAHAPSLSSPIKLAPTLTMRTAPPMPLTSFVGRDRELATVAATIESNRLVTVVGPGGVGKTRLAFELGRTVDVGRELVVVELAPVLEDDAVAGAVADAVGASGAQSSGGQERDPISQSVSRLGSRDVLIVLDNCEHVVAATAAVATALLHGCPNVRLVATSREPLGVDGERQIMLAPLDVASASTLFLDRARAVQPHLDVDAVDDGQLTDLCRHLDGLPLAIELAAARTKTLPLPEISSRLQDRFQLLRRTGRAGISHHEGLRAAIDWSYELLFTDEQRTFRRLAVFAGGATISAAEAVCGPEAFETATRLVDRSLLIADTSGDRVRLGMLESIREYGREQLLAAGELDDARTAHLAWCVELAERVDVEVRRADQLEWLARLDREHDNMCAALAYGVERDPASALRLIGALSTPWWFRGRRPEMRHWTAVSLAAAPDVPSKDRARALAYQGFIAEPAVHPVPGQVEGELEAAEQRQRDAVTMGRALGDARVVASAQLRLMSTMTRRAAAGALLDRAEFAALADDTYGTYDLEGDHYGAGCTMVSAAIGALVTGDFDAAARATDSARRHAEASGERFVMSRVAYLDGVMADLAGDSAAAYRHVEQSLRLLDELGHESVTAQARLLAVLADRGDRPELAEQWRRFADARSDTWSHFDGSAFATAHNHAGLRARGAGDLDRAAVSHATALAWHRDAGLTVSAAFAASCLGFLASERGDLIAARRHHAAALDLAAERNDGAAVALALEGAAASVNNRHEDAARLLGAAARRRASGSAVGEPTHREDVSAVGAALREILGDEGFEREHEEGRGLDESSSIALAAALLAGPGP